MCLRLEATQHHEKKGKSNNDVQNSKWDRPRISHNLFTYKNKITNYRLPSISSGLCLPQPRTNSMKNSFMYDGAKLWNSIPNEIRESKSLSAFKKILLLTFSKFSK
jgi:hypothetical protein